jgi:hypothetical protein
MNSQLFVCLLRVPRGVLRPALQKASVEDAPAKLAAPKITATTSVKGGAAKAPPQKADKQHVRRISIAKPR